MNQESAPFKPSLLTTQGFFSEYVNGGWLTQDRQQYRILKSRGKRSAYCVLLSVTFSLWGLSE